jgi:hypothetical protein
MRCAECSRRWHKLGQKRFGVDAAKWPGHPVATVMGRLPGREVCHVPLLRMSGDAAVA